MMKALMLGAAVALAPLAATAQGIPAPVITETTRTMGGVTTDALRSNMDQIERERAERERSPKREPATPLPPTQPMPQSAPQPMPMPQNPSR